MPVLDPLGSEKIFLKLLLVFQLCAFHFILNLGEHVLICAVDFVVKLVTEYNILADLFEPILLSCMKQDLVSITVCKVPKDPNLGFSVHDLYS